MTVFICQSSIMVQPFGPTNWWASPKNSEPQPETKTLIVTYSEETTEKINLARHKSKTDPAI